MDDENEMIVLIVENDTEVSNLQDLSEGLDLILNPETGEFSQLPVIKQELSYSDIPAIKGKFNEFDNALALNEISKTLHKTKEFAKTSVIKEEYEFDNDLASEELNNMIDEDRDFCEKTEIKEEINESEYDLALKELSGITQEQEHEDTISLTCLKEELYLPHSNEFLKTEKHIDEHHLETNNKLKSSKHQKKNHLSSKEVKKRGHKFLKPLSEHKSFVNELRCQFPELEQDEELLVSTLANIMKDIKTPIPPTDSYVMNGTKYECSFCGELTRTKWIADRHYQYRHGQRYLICFACGTDFRSVTTLYKHEKRCCNKDAVIVLRARAQIIGDRGRNRPFLNEEERLLEREKKSAESKQRLMCSECPAEFSTKVSLEMHTRLHRGFRPFRCDVCTAAYTSESGLKRHMQKHSTKEYICDICQKVFKIKFCLINHLDTHLPEKKYGCIECGRRYTKKQDLNAHITTKHRNQPYPHSCAICNKGFARISALKYHMKHKHGMTIITRRALLYQLPTLPEEALQKAELLVQSGVMVKNVNGSSKIVAPR